MSKNYVLASFESLLYHVVVVRRMLLYIRL